MPRTYVAWITEVIFDDQSRSYHGPFLTEARALQYTASDRIVDFKVLPLVIPYHIHVEITER